MGEPTTRPPVARGALIVYAKPETGTLPSRRIVFQYNPDGLRRSFATRTAAPDPKGAGPAREAVLSVPGPPVETITLTVELDAADQLEDPAKHDAVDADGLQGALAALELLLYPATAAFERVQAQALVGAVQVTPADTPLVVLSWGKKRAMPVQLTSLSVSEEQHDPRLYPIRAKVELGLKVLTYMEFPRESIGREKFIAHQKRLEELAKRWVGA